jgi:hypothetical protein
MAESGNAAGKGITEFQINTIYDRLGQFKS